MAPTATLTAAGTGDPISNAVSSPEASLFTRNILEAALAAGPASWTQDAMILLANVLMNDYLNWWNGAGASELRAAEDWLRQATAISASGGAPALLYHAQGLLYRANRNHKPALAAFRSARNFDLRFARAHAQFGNQKILLGRESEAHAPLDSARALNPHHLAIGYVYWADGRAYFQERLWRNAVYWLRKSVVVLRTVWYNRCYLAAALDAAGDPAGARQVMDDFKTAPGFDPDTYRRIVPSLQPNAADPPTVAAARQTVLDFVKQYLP